MMYRLQEMYRLRHTLAAVRVSGYRHKDLRHCSARALRETSATAAQSLPEKAARAGPVTASGMEPAGGRLSPATLASMSGSGASDLDLPVGDNSKRAKYIDVTEKPTTTGGEHRDVESQRVDSLGSRSIPMEGVETAAAAAAAPTTQASTQAMARQENVAAAATWPTRATANAGATVLPPAPPLTKSIDELDATISKTERRLDEAYKDKEKYEAVAEDATKTTEQRAFASSMLEAVMASIVNNTSILASLKIERGATLAAAARPPSELTLPVHAQTDALDSPSLRAAPVALSRGSDPDVVDLVSFLRDSYPQRAQPKNPISTIGASFPFLGRDAAIERLAENVAKRYDLYQRKMHGDRMFQLAGVAASGSGYGKTRLLWEALPMLQGYVASGKMDHQLDSLNAGGLPATLNDGVRLYVSYGNQDTPLEWELEMSGVMGGFALRLLRAHFCPDGPNLQDFVTFMAKHCFTVPEAHLCQTLRMRTALQAIAYDVALERSERGELDDANGRPCFFLLSIDDFNELCRHDANHGPWGSGNAYGRSTNAASEICHNLLADMVAPSHTLDDRIIFLQPLLGASSWGTVMAEIGRMFAFRLATPPLSIDDTLAILRTKGMLPPTQPPLLSNQQFLELVANLSGHPRSLDYLVQVMHASEVVDVSSADTMKEARSMLHEDLDWHYRRTLPTNSDLLVTGVKAALLREPVDFESFDDIANRGLVLRVDRLEGPMLRTRLHVPILFLDLWNMHWRSNPAFHAVNHIFKDGLHAHVAATATPLERFAMEVFCLQALRLACTTGTRGRSLEALLLHGAVGKVHDMWGWGATVEPQDRIVSLPQPLPSRALAKSYGCLQGAQDQGATGTSDLLDLRRVLMGMINADDAPFDFFSSRVSDRNGRPGMLCMQIKRTNRLDGDELSLEQIQVEYARIREAMTDKRLRTHFGCTNARLPFVVLLLTVKPLAANVTEETLPPQCFVVGRKQFPDYFGTIFEARLEIAARAANAALNM